MTTSKALIAVPSADAAGKLSVRSTAEAFAKSGFFADAKQAAQALVKIIAGRELGFGDVASMTGIYIVKGRVTLSAHFMGAAIKRTGKYRFTVSKLSNAACEIRFHERVDGKWEDVGTSAFGMEDAKLAGLTSNDTYKKFPRNMLYARAMSNGARWYCPDAFTGCVPYLPDEIPGSAARITEEGEYTDCEVVRVTPSGPPASEEGVARLQDLIRAAGSDPARLATHYGVETLSQLTQAQCDEAVAILEARVGPTEATTAVAE